MRDNGPLRHLRWPGWPRHALGRPGRVLRRPRRVLLRTRVLAGVLAVTVVALAGFDLAAVSLARRYLLSQTDGQLQDVLNLFQPHPFSVRLPKEFAIAGPRTRAARTPGHGGGGGQPRANPSAGSVRRADIVLPAILNEFRVVYVSGRREVLLLRGPGLQPRLPVNWRSVASARAPQTVVSRNGVQLRLRATPTGGGALVATTSLAPVNSTLARLELIVIAGSVAAAALAGAGAAWIVRRGLRPIETMAAAADRITAGDLTDRVRPHDPGTEMGRLGAALNGMLARISAGLAEREASQQATRRFFADASHELRTPLASLRAHAELYQQGALPERAQVDQAMARIAAEAQRMGKLVDDMLGLARLDQHRVPARDDLDLAALIAAAVRRAAAADPARVYHARLPARLAATGDEELLRRALDNLLANVAAHTPPGTTATVTATLGDDTIVIEVADDGPGVPSAQLSRIFDRFYRAPAQPRPGSGLGLAIVAATAGAHHGTVAAMATRPHGLTITLTLPTAGSDAPAASEADTAALDTTGATPPAACPDSRVDHVWPDR
jgi:two-component system, OmpR family, sensor kinase